ncbi:MAG: prolyl oligopeptidase family serine peptidase [Solirubrobacterales bacterium]|nr:prolyl oligopeptidase family serine peptidase [Solirubrobacterales bacterium]
MTSVHFKDDEFQYGLEVALGSSYRQAADVGEVLATAGRIEDGDADSWVQEWTATAGAAWSAAIEAEQCRRRVSALAHFRRAATYYATGLYRISHSSEPERELELWRRQRECWEHAVDLFPAPGERVAIPYEQTTLQAYFFRAPDSRPGESRPLVVVNNGSDGATSQMWVHGGAAASHRGYHWMTFDGPGQQAALFEQGIPFRPDWEAVLTPVLDAMLARPDVDPDRIAVIGISQAGYWVPRALAFEHRFAAAVVDPGVVDVSSSWLDPLPEAMRNQLRNGQRTAFDREMHLVGLFSPQTAATLRFRGKPYGVNGGSVFALYETVGAYRLAEEEIEHITTPMLITDPEGEQFWPGQSQQLYDHLTGPKALVRFRAGEGAGRHCEPLACAQRDTHLFDWLDQYLGDHDPGVGVPTACHAPRRTVATIPSKTTHGSAS